MRFVDAGGGRGYLSRMKPERCGEGDGSITGWIAGLKSGDLAAAQPLWERYLRGWWTWRDAVCVVPGSGAEMRPATRKMRRFQHSTACALAWPGRFPQLGDRDDLWRLLVVITTRKVSAQGRRRLRQKRGGGLVQPASELAGPDSEDDILARAVGSEPTPEFAAMVAEEYRRLLDRLGDDVLRQVAIHRMEGFTGDAIAEKLGSRAAPSRGNWR